MYFVCVQYLYAELYKLVHAGGRLETEPKKAGWGAGAARQVLARSVLPESVFGFAFADYLDLDLAIFTLALLFGTGFSPFSSRPLLSSLRNLSRCESASSHHILGNQAVVVIARWNASGANTEAHPNLPSIHSGRAGLPLEQGCWCSLITTIGFSGS